MQDRLRSLGHSRHTSSLISLAAPNRFIKKDLSGLESAKLLKDLRLCRANGIELGISQVGHTEYAEEVPEELGKDNQNRYIKWKCLSIIRGLSQVCRVLTLGSWVCVFS